MHLILKIILIFWIVCFILNILIFWQSEVKDSPVDFTVGDLTTLLVLSVFGPITLFSANWDTVLLYITLKPIRKFLKGLIDKISNIVIKKGKS